MALLSLISAGGCHARGHCGVLVEQSGRATKARGQDRCQEEHPGRGNPQEESGRTPEREASEFRQKEQP